MDNPRPSFEAEVKPLFRERDQRAMAFMFDLWDYEAVKANAGAILAASPRARCRATAGGARTRWRC